MDLHDANSIRTYSLIQEALTFQCEYATSREKPGEVKVPSLSAVDHECVYGYLTRIDRRSDSLKQLTRVSHSCNMAITGPVVCPTSLDNRAAGPLHDTEPGISNVLQTESEC